MRLVRLACLTLAVGACTSADGEVFRPVDGSSRLPCAPAPFVIHKTQAASSFTLAGAGNEAVVVAQIEDEARLFKIQLPSPATTPLVSQFVVGRSGYTFGVAAAVGEGPLWMVFQNHSLAGQWRIYGAPWNETTGLDDTLLPVSNDGSENVGPKAAWLGNRLGIAFRQDFQLAFVVTQGGAVMDRDVGLAVAPHPLVERVLAGPQGFIVSYRRTQPAIAYYDADGKWERTVELSGSAADVTLLGTTLVAITAGAAGMQRVTFNAEGEAQAKPLDVTAPNVAVLRVATQANHVALAFLENEATANARLRFLWNQGESSLVYPALAAPNATALEVVPTSQGVLVVYLTDAALMGRFYCSATTP